LRLIGRFAVPNLSSPQVSKLLEDLCPLVLRACSDLDLDRKPVVGNDHVKCVVSVRRSNSAVVYIRGLELGSDRLGDKVLERQPAVDDDARTNQILDRRETAPLSTKLVNDRPDGLRSGSGADRPGPAHFKVTQDPHDVFEGRNSFVPDLLQPCEVRRVRRVVPSQALT
jgi:hypothetical protein